MDEHKTLPVGTLWPRVLTVVAILALGMGLTSPGVQATEVEDKHCRVFQRLGLPVLRGDFPLGQHKRICRPGYALLHNAETKNPDWVIELLTRKNLRGTAVR